MIWYHAAADRSQRSIFVLSANEDLKSLDPHGKLHVLHKARAIGVDPPAPLHACFLSREAALKHYTLSFEGSLKRPVYFDYGKDKLIMVDQQAWDSFDWHDQSSEVAGESESDNFSKVSGMIGRRLLQTPDSQ
jgi:hypothetical protein